MSKKFSNCVLVLFVVLLTWSVGGFTNAAEPPGLAQLRGAEKGRVSKLIEAAKKEGELLFYSVTFRPDVQAVVVPAFRKEYGLSESDLKIKILSSRTSSIITKVTEELRAGIYKTDVVQNSHAWFRDLVSRGDLMAYDCPEYKNFHPIARDPAISQALPPYFIGTEILGYGITYNPKYIRGEIVHWKDVLRPEYEGKICCADVSKSLTYADGYLQLRKVLDASFFEELGKRKPFIIVSNSALINKAVSGEYPLMVLAAESIVWRVNQKGAGLKFVYPPEGWAAIAYPLAIMARAPHPNAAKLFMDFIHGPYGQKLLQEKTGSNAGRLGLEISTKFPRPIYNIEGSIEMDWEKITNQDRLKAQEEFRRLVIAGKN